ncbi:helix-turn-helix transcriptional regulator [uncultured Pontibacter sp.]|uniref:helix-turn-helix domain-containing protein n=1 Tax=uncultured Pontibacter sp. TaxID=453356 RepID=UPI0026085EBC|nr:helix-turn-helix transcriptional regulator [uncultured Pontibacter sp.]
MIGSTVRCIRSQKGYSQEYMAFQLNISQNAYSKLERGETEITVRRIYQIADVLEVSVYELLPQSVASSSINLKGLTGILMRIRLKLFAAFTK